MMKLILLWASVFVAFLLTANQAQAQAMTYHGRIVDSSTNLGINGLVTFRVQVRTPTTAADNCVMYEEEIAQTLVNGVFTLQINSGAGTRLDSTGYTVQQIFSNKNTFGSFNLPGVGCASSNPYLYNAGASDGRRVVITFNDGTMPPGTFEPLPTQAVNYVPGAIEALNIGGFPVESLMRVVGAGGAPTMVSPLSNAQYTELLNLVTGASTQYLLATDPAVGFTGNLSGDVTGGQSATSVRRIYGVPVSATAPTPGQYMIFDGSQWRAQAGSGGTVQSVSSGNAYITVTNPSLTPVITLNVGTAANTVAAGDDARITGAFQSTTALSGDLSGTLPAPSVVSIGGRTSLEVANTVAAFQSATSNATGNELVRRDASGNASFVTAQATNFSGRNVYLFDGSNTNSVRILAPAVLGTGYTLTLPTTTPVAGNFLGTDAAGNLAWYNPTAGSVTSVTASAPLVSSGGFTPNISLPAATNAASGYLTSADWTTFNNKQSTALPTGQVWIGDAGGVAAARNFNITDVRSSIAPFNAWFNVAGACAAGETLTYSPVNDRVSCQPYSLTTAQVVSALGYTPTSNALPMGQILVGNASGTATPVTMGGDALLAADGTLTIQTNAITTGKIANGAVTDAKIATGISWTKITSTPTTIAGYGITDAILTNAGGVTTMQANTFASRPAAGTAGRMYVSTDTGEIFRDNGAAWVLVGSATGSGGTVTGVTGTSPIVVTNGTSTPIVSITQASNATSGYLSSADWTTFNNKIDGGLTSGRIWVGNLANAPAQVLMAGDATISNDGTLTLANTAVTPGAGYTKFTVDSKGRLTLAGNINSADVTGGLGFTPLNRAGDTMSGALNLSSNDLTNAGNILMTSNRSIGVSNLTAAQETTLVGTLAPADTGRFWYNTTLQQLRYWNGSAALSIANTLGAISNLNGLTAASQDFSAGSAGTDFAITSAGSTHTFNIPTQSGTATRGLVTSADWTRFDAKLGPATAFSGDISGTYNALQIQSIQNRPFVLAAPSTSDYIRWNGTAFVNSNLVSSDITNSLGFTPSTNALPNGQIFVGSGGGVATAVSLSGDATLANTGVMTLSNSGVAAGTYGSANAVPSFTVDAKGRLTLAGSQAYQDATGAGKGIVQVGPNISVTGGVISITSNDVTNALGFTPTTNALPVGQIFIGNVSGQAAPQTMAGDAIISADGTLTIQPNAISTGKIADGAVTDMKIATGISWTKITSTPTTIAGYGITDAILVNGGGVSSVAAGTMAARPVAGTVGRVYISTDTGEIFRDNGAAWILVGSATGSGGTVTNVSVAPPMMVMNSTSTPTISLSQADNSNDGYLTSGDWTRFDSKLDGTLTNGRIWIGNVGNVPTAVILSGDASLANDGTFTLAPSGVVAGQYTKLTVDAKGRVTVGGNLSSADVTGGLGFTPLNRAGDTMSGVLNMGSNDLTNAGNILMTANRSIGISNLTAAQETTLVGTLAPADTGRFWYNSTLQQLRYWNGSAALSIANTTGAIANLNGLTATSQDFTVGSAGTDFAIVSAGSTHTFNIPTVNSIAAPTVNRGLLSSADWTTFNNKLGTTTAFSGDVSGTYNSTVVQSIQNRPFTLGAPSTGDYVRWNGTAFINSQLVSSDITGSLGFTPSTNALPDGQIFVGSAGGVATAVPLSGDATIVNSGVMTLRNTAVTPGTYGSANAVPSFTVDAKGRLTLAGSQAYQDATGAGKGIVQVGPNISISGGVISLTSTDVTGALGYTPTTAALNNGMIFVGNASNVATAVNLSGDAVISNDGTLTIQPNAISTAKIADGAVTDVKIASGISWTKITSTPTTISGYGITNGVVNLGAGAASDVNGLLAGTMASRPVAGTAGRVYFSTDTQEIFRDSGIAWILLGSADGSGGTVTNVSVAPPMTVVNSTSTPTISMSQADGTTDGYITSGDWTRFDSKLANTLNNGRIWVGNVGNVPTPVQLSGDATLANDGTLTLITTGVGAGQYTKVTVDTKGRVTAATNLSSADVTTALSFVPLNRAGDTMSGTLNMGSNDITNAGNILMTANRSIGVSNLTSAQETTLVGSLGLSDTGRFWYNSTTQQLKYWNGTSALTVANTAGSIANLNGLTAVSQDFSVGSAGTNFNIVSAGSTHTFNIPTASAVNRGLLSSSDYSSFAAKIDQSATFSGDVTGTYDANQIQRIQNRPFTLGAPSTGDYVRWNGTAFVNSQLVSSDITGSLGFVPATNALPNGQIFVGSAGGQATAVNLSGDATIVNSGVLTISNNAITTAKINDSAVTTSKVADGAITNIKIAAGVDWAKITSTPTTIAGYGITNGMVNFGSGAATDVTGFTAGSLAARPIAGNAGRMYVATDTQELYRDSGIAWVLVSSASGAGGTVTSVTGTGPISVVNTTSTPVISIARATTGVDGYLASSDFTTFNNKIDQAAVFSGDITGTYNATTIVNNAVTTSKVADGAITNIKIATGVEWSKITSTPTTIAGYGITNAVANLGSGAASDINGLLAGSFAGRPAASTAGRVYFATDTQQIFRDTGAAWVLIASATGSGGTVTNVSVAAPLAVINPTSTPIISLSQADGTNDGYLNSGDWSRFDAKLDNISSDVTGALGYTPVNRAGDTMTGALGIGGAPVASSILSLSSTSQGFLLPRMTSAERTAIAAPATGLQVYDTNLNTIYFWSGSAWTAVATGGTAISNLNGLTAASQDFTVGSAGTNFNIVSAGSTHTFNIPTASAVNRGLLASADYTAFSNKIDQSAAFSGDVTGTYNANQIQRIQNRTFTLGAPSTGDYVRWNGTAFVNSQLVSSDITGSLGFTPATNALPNGQIFVGSAGGQATAVNLSGDATIVNSGVLTISNNAITTAKVADGAITNIKIAAGVDWAKITSTPTTIGGYGITNGVINFGSSAASDVTGFTAGTFAARPIAGNAGRVYIATDTQEIFRDSGIAWVRVGSNSGAGGTVTNVSVAAPLSVINPTSTPIISLSQADGTNDGYLTSGDWTRFDAKLGVTTTFSGDVTGTYDATTIANNAVTTAKINNGAVTDAKIASGISWAKITSTPTTLVGYGITDSVTNVGGVVSIQANTFASRPAAGTAGRLYVSTDTQEIFRDTGATWTLVSSASGAGGTVTSVTGTGPISITNTTSTPVVSIARATAGADGYLASSDFTTFSGKLDASAIFSGDVTGAYNATQIQRIQNRTFTLGAPSTGDYVRWNGTAFVNSQLVSSDITGSLGFTPATNALPNGQIFVGSAGGTATAVNLSGDATIVNSGVLTISNNAITTAKINDSAVTTSKVADGAITNIKIATGIDWAKITSTPTTIAGYGITNGMVNFGSSAGTDVTGFSAGSFASRPVAGNAGRMYVATDTQQVFRDSGVAWVLVGSANGAGGTVTNVSVAAPLAVINPTSTPIISLSQADGTNDGYLNSGDWTRFDAKLDNVSSDITGALGYIPVNRAGDNNMTGQFGIGGAAPASAVLSLTSTSQGFLIPRMTTGQRTGIAAPAIGLQVYDTDLNALYVNTNSGWTAVGSGSGTVTSVTGTSPITITNTTSTPVVSIARATAAVNGYLASSDFTIFAAKLDSSSAFSGDVTGTIGATSIANNAVTTAKVADGAITNVKIATGIDWAKITSTPTTLVGYGITNGIANLGSGAASDITGMQAGTFAGRPVAATAGRVYMATDTQQIFRDNGVTWDLISSASGAGGTVTSVTGTGPISVVNTTSTPVISVARATTGVDGYLASSDFTTFNNKLSGSSLTNGSLVVGSGTTTPTFLAPGSNGNVLYVTGGAWTSGTPTAANLVTLTGVQTISGGKGFSSYIQMNDAATLRFADSDSSNYVGLRAPNTVTTNLTWTLPSGDGTSGQALVTNGAGQLGWSPVLTSITSTDVTTAFGGAIPVSAGGTGATTIPLGSLVQGNGTSAVTAFIPGTAGNVVYGSGIGTWSSATPDVAGLVDKTSTQAISGAKAFTNYVQMSTQSPLRFADADSSNFVAFRAPATVTTDLTWTLPSGDGSNGQVLTTDGAGNLSWSAGGGGGSGTVTSVTSANADIAVATTTSTPVLTLNSGTAGGGGDANKIAKLDASGLLAVNMIPDLNASKITAGTLPVGRGGTGATTFTSNGVLLGNGTGAVTATTAGGNYSVLRVPAGGGAPAFGAIDISQSNAVTGTLGVANGGTGRATLTSGSIIVGNGTGTVNYLTAGAANDVIYATGAGAWTTGTRNAAGIFSQSGNSFGATAVLGTNDGNSLHLETNNVVRVSMDTSGGVQVNGQAWSEVGTSSAASPLGWNANTSNTMRWTTNSATPTVNITNMKAGASYMLVVKGSGTGAVTITCAGPGVSSSTPLFVPANGNRVGGTANSKTVYTIMADGENCLVSWITGY